MPNARSMQVRDAEGDPTPTGLAASGTVVVVVAAGGAAAATSGSTWIAPIIALIAAVFVAILTAVTTNRRQAKQLEKEEARQTKQLEEEAARQTKQLAEEGARQAKQLEEERARLVLQLAYERDLGELAQLREFFDEAATLFESRLAASTAYAEAILDADDEAIETALQTTVEEHQAMAIFERRFGLRFPVQHPVSIAFLAASQVLQERETALTAMWNSRTFVRDEDLANASVAGTAWRTFMDEARAELDRRASATD
jgi:hypothetical protein